LPHKHFDLLQDIASKLRADCAELEGMTGIAGDELVEELEDPADLPALHDMRELLDLATRVEVFMEMPANGRHEGFFALVSDLVGHFERELLLLSENEELGGAEDFDEVDADLHDPLGSMKKLIKFIAGLRLIHG